LPATFPRASPLISSHCSRSSNKPIASATLQPSTTAPVRGSL
jgi:hypothetical protein